MGFLDNLFGAQSLPSSPTSQSTQTSTQTSTPSIQPQFQPYISDYLNKAQQLASSQATPELLNQSYVEAKGLQLPGGFASGARLAEAGGQGSLSTAPIALGYGQRGAEYGQQGTKYGEMGSAMGQVAARAGDIYGQQATSPQAIQAYMSPYMQNVVDYQKQQAVRDFAKQTPALQAQAVGQGAYGGSRQAIVQAEANRALNSQLQGIEALGQQQAYQQAQQAQQFGANLGLQGQQVGIQGQQLGLAGLGTAMQGQQIGLQGVGGAQAGYAGATQAGGTLGNIAAQEAQARLAALQLKNQFGLQQQMFPYQQAQFQQQMIANLPFASSTTTGSTTGQGYQAPPNYMSQLGGLGLTLGSIYALTKAKGGVIKSYADGGEVKNSFLSDMGSDMGMADYLRNNPEVATAMNAVQGGGGMLGNAASAPGMFAGYNRMSPEASSAMGAGLAGLMPTQNSDNAAYVNSLYANMLGRQADQAGLEHNLGLLNAGKIDQQGLANAFMASQERQAMPKRVPQLMGAGMPASSGLADIRLNQLLGAR
jgi:hypothetical protein